MPKQDHPPEPPPNSCNQYHQIGIGHFFYFIFLFGVKPLAFYLELELFWWKTVLWDFFMNYLMGKKSLLPLGFRFHPTDVELVMYYLKWKVMGKEFCFEAIAEVDIYKFAPWGLPEGWPSPRNGAQYGTPFEEDWNDDNEVNCVEAGPSLCFSTPTCVLPSDCNSSAITCNLFWIAFFLSHVYLKLWHLTARVFQQFPLMILF
ncbi:uncharacterized protein LOC121250911 [Juglans microcarpa x Juglans regia]|uniref:uncharacterized protein LOC121250911 n=1 Tax=Juglans microcarpa x Juglans regia TaxID=2249226 RepID=UPI001B7D94E7|nr:uncharacterized protein LOC121250911 [Juglans microcarpa x Juglans regia]